MRQSELYTKRTEWRRQVEALSQGLRADAEAWASGIASARGVSVGLVWAALDEIGREAYDRAHDAFVYGTDASAA